MNTIHHYSLEVGKEEIISVPPRTKVVHFGNRHGNLTVWVEKPMGVEDSETLHLKIFGTGWQIPEHFSFIQTHVNDDDRGFFVWHLYQRKL